MVTIQYYKLFACFVGILLIIGLTSCGADAGPVIVSPLPTTMMPSTPTDTPVPVTLSPTVAAAGPEISITPVPSVSRLRDETPTPGPTPTSPLGPTFTPAPATLTVTTQPTQLGLEIEFFTVTADIIAPGQTITLYWEVSGAERISIFRLNADNEPEEEWRDLLAEGRLRVQADPSDEEGVRFLMVARAGNAVTEEELLVELTCNQLWFFFPPPDGCPTSEPQPIFHVQQQFERGFMIWQETSRQIFVLFNDDQEPRWLQLADEFEEGMPERDETRNTPAGLIQPVRGFGYVWRNNPQIEERLGWAREPETGYDGMIQTAILDGNDQVIYLRARDSQIIELLPDGADWRFIEAGDVPETEATEVPSSLQDN